MAWTDNVPLAANQISADVTALNGNMTYLKAIADDYQVAHNTSGGHNSNFLSIANTTGTLTAAYDGAYLGASSGNALCNLPTAAAAGAGKIYQIATWAVSSTYYARVDPNGTEHIYYTNGLTTVDLGAGVAYNFPATGKLTLYCTGAEWIIIGEEFRPLQDNADHTTDSGALASITIPAASLRVGDIVEIVACATAQSTGVYTLTFGTTTLAAPAAAGGACEYTIIARVHITGATAQRCAILPYSLSLADATTNGYIAGTDAISGALAAATSAGTASITNNTLTVRLLR